MLVRTLIFHLSKLRTEVDLLVVYLRAHGMEEELKKESFHYRVVMKCPHPYVLHRAGDATIVEMAVGVATNVARHNIVTYLRKKGRYEDAVEMAKSIGFRYAFNGLCQEIYPCTCLPELAWRITPLGRLMLNKTFGTNYE